MRSLISALLMILISTAAGAAKVVVFWQDGFPTVESQQVAHDSLQKALNGMQPVFASLEDLKRAETLDGVDLLVLPYGSALPVDGWDTIDRYLHQGGNLLVLGGRAFQTPVRLVNGKFVADHSQQTYSGQIGIDHTYEAPHQQATQFKWGEECSFLPAEKVAARRVFVLDGRNRGLGFLLDQSGDRVAAPVIASDFMGYGGAMAGARIVMLDFEPESGYWDSAAGIALIHEMANYARQGATLFWLELQASMLKPGEIPQVTVHLRNVLRQQKGMPQAGSVKLELASGSQELASTQVTCSGDTVDVSASFQKNLAPGFYTLRGVYVADGQERQVAQNGFWVEDPKILASGPSYGVQGDFLTRGGKPYFPFGTNYFTTDDVGWDFAGPRNSYIWERDFAEMEKHGVTFVRTGVWNGHMKILDPSTGGVSERFLRNVEAYLLSAGRHNIHVNFTFFAFDPQTILRHPGEESAILGPGSNPYTDPVAIRAQQNYLLSIVQRFKDVPYMSWDLINEPSYSNPQHLWRGNTPNNDAMEVAAWHKWLAARYPSIDALAEAWGVTAQSLGNFDSVPLPAPEDLVHSRYGNSRESRALDYNLFAQDMFSAWVKAMVKAIRETGSAQLIDVGQDEGGIADRVLNQFYGGAGVSFTTNHTYWRDDALLWDSLAAKRPGVPNIVGETGYQPVWRPDGTWRYDEVTGFGLLERKWALGFAAANSGSLQWDWSRGGDFGMKRSDGSNKIEEDMMRDMGEFARRSQTYATGLMQPEVAIVLPQSLQLSVFNSAALEAQANCVRALYQDARGSAYVVGEYQIELLGNPRLIILPSPWILSEPTWKAILAKVQDGATLLVSGRFDNDPHFHSTDRQREVGIDYQPAFLDEREVLVKWPEGSGRLTFSGDKTTFQEQAILPGGKTFVEKECGKGKILFVSYPLELNDNLKAVGEIYRYALKVAGVQPAFTTSLEDAGILICPTQFAHATLYVLTSESSQNDVSFRDSPSGKEFNGKLEPGRAALLLVGEKGDLLASYNWK